jgi:hypothetical protein
MKDWSIGLYEGPSPLRLGPVAGTPVLTRDDVHDLDAAFVADPFTLRAGGRSHMFFEIFDRAAGRGRIGHADSRDHRSWRYRGVVLAEEFHLSYPQVFLRDGRFYMVPETQRTGQVRLYAADAFPAGWRQVATLLHEELADATLFLDQSRWWMYACGPRRHDTLHLFGAASLTGAWREHPASPVITADAGRARPAGRPVRWDGSVVRYAQDCRHGYGRGVRAVPVIELTCEHYAEAAAPVDPFRPAHPSRWNAGGMHHIDVIEDDGWWLACVDGWSRP